jgi:hypothetical protein
MENIQSNQTSQELPNSTAVLVLGIISIIGCWCWGIPGLVCGIIALVLASKGENLYNENPSLYKPVTYSNLKAGKICAIIGVCLSGLFLFLVLVKIAFGLAFLSHFTGFDW